METHARNTANNSKKILIFILAIVVIFIILIAVCLNVFASPGINESAKTQSENIVITLHGDVDTVVQKGEDYIESGANAVDREEGNIANSIKIEGDVDTNIPGDYQVKYTATNSKDEYAQSVRNVHVLLDMDKDTDGISVMMYHYVYDDANPPANLNSNFLAASKFEGQLQWLKQNNYYYPSYSELRAYIDGKHSLPKNSVILTFDDGEQGFLTVGSALLSKYQIPATSFFICNSPQYDINLKRFATPYMDFQSHTYALHANGSSGKGKGGKIYDYSQAQIVEDLATSHSILGANQALAYPFGDYDDKAMEACKELNILCAFTVKLGQVNPGSNPYALPRMRVLGSDTTSSFAYKVANGTG